jgi:predicted nucleotidyltransferase
MPARDDKAFLAYVSERLASVPRVDAVALGGSRASGTDRADSDWDFAVYYRGAFSPQDVRGLGWPGEVSEVGGWGGGVFNGGAWLQVDGRHVDVHYRDLDEVEHQLAEAREGRFHIERLLFHLAGIPSYIVVAELAINRVLHGTLPRPEYPEALQRKASERWWGEARHTLTYARAAHAERGHLTETAGAIATAACQAAHGIMAARRRWVTNEKTLLDQAGLRELAGAVGRPPIGLDQLISGLTPSPEALTAAIDDTTRLLEQAFPAA